MLTVVSSVYSCKNFNCKPKKLKILQKKIVNHSSNPPAQLIKKASSELLEFLGLRFFFSFLLQQHSRQRLLQRGSDYNPGEGGGIFVMPACVRNVALTAGDQDVFIGAA